MKANKATPVMQQYLDIKSYYADCLLLFQLGDFYELFFEDAEIASSALGIALTKRGIFEGKPVPMCGVPMHSGNRYVSMLLKQGRKVALCEQLETPEQAKRRGQKNVIKREVTRIITPGTILEDNMLEHKDANYLASLVRFGRIFGLAWVDISTNQFFYSTASEESLEPQLAAIEAKEILLSSSLSNCQEISYILNKMNAAVTRRPDNLVDLERTRKALLEIYELVTLDGIAQFSPAEMLACGTIAEYIQTTQKQVALRLSYPKKHRNSNLMMIDSSTRKSLEISHSESGNSLLKTIDYTKTSMGSRFLKQNLNSPLSCAKTINNRLELVYFFLRNKSLRLSVIDLLSLIPDMERSTSRIILGKGSPLDLHNLKLSLKLTLRISAAIASRSKKKGRPWHELLKSPEPIICILPKTPMPDQILTPAVKLSRILTGRFARTLDQPQVEFCISCYQNDVAVIKPFLSGHLKKYHDKMPQLSNEAKELTQLYRMLGEHGQITDLLEKALVDNPPNNKKEGGYINPYFHPKLEELHKLTNNSPRILEDLTKKYRKATGIQNLKISSNNLIGFYAEIPSKCVLKDSTFKLRQNLANSTRYVTDELLILENKILSAKESSIILEAEIFAQICSRVIENSHSIMMASEAVGKIDFFTSLAHIAEKRSYCRPKVNNSLKFTVVDGRHPVVEVNRNFIPNSTDLSPQNRICLLTGPNMSGKSTFLRQNALLVLMAQIGSFVPAFEAEIGIVDRIFSRVGASDQIAAGKSTFMVEMSETANIINNSTARSLVILDEVGRGTSFCDGLAIAWSILEHIHDINKCRTIFATHYQELCELDKTLAGLDCCRVKTEEWGGQLIFMHKVEKGVSNLSFGIYVAKIAGMPKSVIDRAEKIMNFVQAKNSTDTKVDVL